MTEHDGRLRQHRVVLYGLILPSLLLIGLGMREDMPLLIFVAVHLSLGGILICLWDDTRTRWRFAVLVLALLLMVLASALYAPSYPPWDSLCPTGG